MARTQTQKKILLYAQDGIGLGHLRRLARVAATLQGDYSTLLVSGKREAAWMLPEDCEFIHIPSWSSVGLGPHALPQKQWRALEKEAAIALVQSFVEAIERTYEPDCIIVDHTLTGMYGEIRSMLKKTTAHTFMTFRGIVDEKDARWFESQPRAVHDAIDAILVASDERTSDFGQGDARMPSLASKIQHVGYILPEPGDTASVRASYTIPPGRHWVVCSAGGGKGAEPFLEHCAYLAREFPDVFFDVVMGPYATRTEIQPSPNLRIHSIVHDLPALHAAADIAIINGGYNSLLESIAGGARIIVYPNQENREGEQVTHARRLTPHYPVTLLERIDDLREVLQKELSALTPLRPHFELRTDGAHTIKKIVDAALEV